jgi:hypothetical protein
MQGNATIISGNMIIPDSIAIAPCPQNDPDILTAYAGSSNTGNSIVGNYIIPRRCGNCRVKNNSSVIVIPDLVSGNKVVRNSIEINPSSVIGIHQVH